MARRKKRFQAPDTPERREYQIKQKSWKKYTENLKKLSDKASDELKKYILEGHTEEETIDVAYALVTKYGEASSELACQMYEALAEYSGARVAAAEPAETATYGETARSIRGAMMRTRDAAAISSSAGRLVKLASVDTMMKNALRDGAEWAWIPQGDTCAFCIMLASRGWVKASEDALKNGHAEHIHNNCDCTYCVRFDHETTVEGYDPDALYEEYINAGDTKWERINALRRQHYAANKDHINAQKRAAYARRKHPAITQTGGKNYVPYNPKDPRDIAAASEYRKISRRDDINAVAASSGMTREEIREIKRHIFFEKHKLHEGYGLLHPDYDMAVAWKRLAEGRPEERDILLLKHELLESQLEKEYNLSIAEAHKRAKATYNWEQALEDAVGLDGEKDGLL